MNPTAEQFRALSDLILVLSIKADNNNMNQTLQADINRALTKLDEIYPKTREYLVSLHDKSNKSAPLSPRRQITSNTPFPGFQSYRSQVITPLSPRRPFTTYNITPSNFETPDTMTPYNGKSPLLPLDNFPAFRFQQPTPVFGSSNNSPMVISPSPTF